MLLEIQDPKLAAEEVWAHATPQPERGGLLLATPRNAAVLGTERLWQVGRGESQGWPLPRRACRPGPPLTPGPPLLRTPPPRRAQAVVLLAQHSPAQGSVGLILNRPTNMVLRPGRGGLRYAVVGAPDGMQQLFGDNRVYCGGDVRQDVSSAAARCALPRARPGRRRQQPLPGRARVGPGARARQGAR